MRTLCILSLLVTATFARTRRATNNIRKRSLQGPFGDFNAPEEDYILSIVPPAVSHHKVDSTKSTSPPSSTKSPSKSTLQPLAKLSSNGKGKKSKESKPKGKGDNESKPKGKGGSDLKTKGKDEKDSKPKGKGKGKGKSESKKETPCPEHDAPTTTPDAPQEPTLSPVRSPAATPSSLVTTPPQPTQAPTTLLSRPTMETQQAPTNLPTPLSTTSVPTTSDGTTTDVPTTMDETRTSAPTAVNAPSTGVPTTVDGTSSPTALDTATGVPTTSDVTRTSAPTALDTATGVPTTSDVTRTSAPTALTVPSTSAPTSATTEVSPTSVPVDLPTGDFETTLNLDQVPARFHGVFENAAARWDTIIVGDLEDYPIYEEDRTNPELLCDGDSLPDIVDDVFICASLPNIDGPNGILGAAGPIYGRIGEFIQTAVGYMEFDLADIEILETQGRLDGLILHEMAHVERFGGKNGLVTDTPDCPYLYDSKASEEYRALSGCDTAVPTETTGGSGTACLHWSESCFQTELMTGVNTGDQELSRISIATLEDMGYVVDYSQADPFTVDQMNPSCVCSANSVVENEFQLSNGASMNFRWNEDRRSLRHDTTSIDKEREQAILYGKQKLQNSRQPPELALRNTDPRRVYLADKVTQVLYFDKDEQIKSVLVTSDP